MAIHRIAVILDMDTKALKLTMPNHDIAQSGAYASYYRLTPEAYQKLFNQVMEESERRANLARKHQKTGTSLIVARWRSPLPCLM